MLDILFINPPSPDDYIYIRDVNRSGRRSSERTIWPQTSLAYPAAIMREAGYTVDLLDCIASGYDWEFVKKYLVEHRPRWIVTNPISSIVSNDLMASYYGKTVGAQSIACGPHVTALPEATLNEYPSLDYVICREIEGSILELIQTVEKEGDLFRVKGIAFRDEEGTPVVTEERPYIDDLDSLPIPAHDLLPVEKHRLPFIGSNYTFVLHSRGCPYPCNYCRQPIMWGRRVRKRSAESIYKELVHLGTLGVDNIMFHSDTFTIDKQIVLDLCRLIVENGLKVRWICNSRVDTIDEEMLGWMKRAGCWMIAYGIESGDDDVLKSVEKGGKASVAQARKTVLASKKAGIRVWGYFIMGLLGDTKESMERTMNFACELPLDLANFAVAAPYPGTKFNKIASENNWLLSTSWEDFDQNYSAVVNYNHLSTDDIRAAIRKAYMKYYLNPKRALRTLKMTGNTEELGQLMRIAGDHLKIWS